jgi:hypothetical protein
MDGVAGHLLVTSGMPEHEAREAIAQAAHSAVFSRLA